MNLTQPGKGDIEAHVNRNLNNLLLISALLPGSAAVGL